MVADMHKVDYWDFVVIIQVAVDHPAVKRLPVGDILVDLVRAAFVKNCSYLNHQLDLKEEFLVECYLVLKLELYYLIFKFHFSCSLVLLYFIFLYDYLTKIIFIFRVLYFF